MDTSQKIFFGITLLAGLYLAAGWGMGAAETTIAQYAKKGVVQAQVGNQTGGAGGHYMPDGQWMADSAMTGGMGCGMGGGCNCGGGR
ncbi:MAG: hypothetical protein PHZ00_00795 [Candidatus Peribacteraceae bacterium]|nr:hypothetical protein [Candidatus Peribacteraceae bacterium]